MISSLPWWSVLVCTFPSTGSVIVPRSRVSLDLAAWSPVYILLRIRLSLVQVFCVTIRSQTLVPSLRLDGCVEETKQYTTSTNCNKDPPQHNKSTNRDNSLRKTKLILHKSITLTVTAVIDWYTTNDRLG